MTLTVERSNDIGHGQPGADNQHAIVGSDVTQRVRLPRVGDKSRMMAQRRDRRRHLRWRVAHGEHHGIGVDVFAVPAHHTIAAAMRNDRAGSLTWALT